MRMVDGLRVVNARGLWLACAVVAASLMAPAAARATAFGPDVSSNEVSQAEQQARVDWNRLPALPPVAHGAIVTIHLVAEVKPWTPAPGVTVQAYTYNGTVPGPTIHVRVGQRVRVVLTNHLSLPTTIHWHGIRVPADMDGVPGLSQEAVPPGASYTYEFTAADAGTYIYHSHYDGMNELDRGLYGAFIVEPPRPTPEKFDRDYLMLLSSWRINSDTENYFSINGLSYPLTKAYEVRHGDRVRIREIDISGTELHTMHIHGHHFTIIAEDGQPVPLQARQQMSTVLLGPGETRDVAFVANAQPGTWMVHCHIEDHMMNGGAMPGGLITAIHYAGTPERLSSLAQADPTKMASSASGPPMAFWPTVILGAIAGLTIFFGLPVAAFQKLPPKALAFFNAIAIGVLFFLLYDIVHKAADPVETALRAAQGGGGTGGFVELVATFVLGLGVGLVGLVIFTHRMVGHAKTAIAGGLAPMALALAIAFGIGLHNFSEGLAIGQSAATGAIQLALMLIIGFGLHNMTEGFGIAAPLAGTGGASASSIVRLGLIGGGPTFLGTVVGYRFVSPLLSVLFLTLAAGAIIYVIGEMLNAGRRIGFREYATLGVFLGFVFGYGTDLILTYAGA